MSRPFIMVAPNGARRGVADHPALPVTIAQITQTAAACHAAGAEGLHLHVRDENGAHSLDAGLYREALSELARAAPDLRVQITTEAADIFDVSAQLACLEQVRPAWASIALREIARAPELAQRVYGTCAANGTQVQHILYDTADFELLRAWQTRGIVPAGQNAQIFVLGRYATGRQSHPSNLGRFLQARDASAPWMVCAFGSNEHECLLEAARHGGDLRVGFENSLQASDGQIWPDCAASVAALVAKLAKQPVPSATYPETPNPLPTGA